MARRFGAHSQANQRSPGGIRRGARAETDKEDQMRGFELGRKAAALGLAASMTLATQYATMAEAKMLSTETAIARYAAEADRAHLLAELDRAEVRDEMIAMGVDPAEAESRLRALTDAEVARMIEQMDADAAGAGIVGVLATIFIILLVTDLLCLTRVFSFTRCQR